MVVISLIFDIFCEDVEIWRGVELGEGKGREGKG